MKREPFGSLVHSLFDCFTDASLNDHWYDSFIDAAGVLHCWLCPQAANKKEIGQ